MLLQLNEPQKTSDTTRVRAIEPFNHKVEPLQRANVLKEKTQLHESRNCLFHVQQYAQGESSHVFDLELKEAKLLITQIKEKYPLKEIVIDLNKNKGGLSEI